MYEKSMAFCKIEGLEFDFHEPTPKRGKQAFVRLIDSSGTEVGSVRYSVNSEVSVQTTEFITREEKDRYKGVGTALASALTEHYHDALVTESGFEKAYSKAGRALLKGVREKGIPLHQQKCFRDENGNLNCSCELSGA